MQDQANELVPPASRPDPRRVLRTAWAGAVATVTAGGLLFAAAPSVPGMPVAGHGQDRTDRHQELIAAVAVARSAPTTPHVITTPRHVSMEQVTAVLARADDEAERQGPRLSPVVAQAAAELGMLYTTYRMQQLAFGEATEGLRVQDAPVARAARDDDATAAAGTGRLPAAIPVSDVHGAAAGTEDVDLPSGRITYEQVVLAAVRLANLLDPSVPLALVEVEATGEDQEPASRGTGEVLAGRSGAGGTLRASLLDVVSTFGGSTLEYANGRIPAAVLCPLDFAPGHLLRCDAAERFTALNAKFEEEFGHPIPITDSYRSYVQQVAVADAKPHLAALPGTSNHGWGLAVDLGAPISGGVSAQYVWLRVHGPDYGWDNPSWARPNGSKPEPWHFEFFAAGSVPDRAIDPSDIGTWTSDDPSEPAFEAAARDPRSEGGSSADKPRTTPDDEPRKNPPTKKPSEPATSPRPSDPVSKPAPKPAPKPTPKPSPSPSPSDPTPKPTPSPTPSPSPSDPGEPSTPPSPTPSQPAPSPSPAPSEPAPSPSPAQSAPSPEPAPSGSGTPSSPAPSPSPSAGPDSLLGLAEELGLTDDDQG